MGVMFRGLMNWIMPIGAVPSVETLFFFLGHLKCVLSRFIILISHGDFLNVMKINNRKYVLPRKKGKRHEFSIFMSD